MSNYTFWKFLKEDFGITPKSILKWLILFWLFVGAVSVITNLSMNEGYTITIRGTVQRYELEHDKIFNYDYTTIELRSFSGRDKEISFVDHYHFDLGASYEITYVRVSPLGHHVFLLGKILEIRCLQGSANE